MAEKKPIGELQVDGIDIKGGLARIGNNKMIYKRVLGKFVDDATFQGLKDALGEADLKKASIAAHTLKGVVGNLGLAELLEVSTKMDLLLKTGIIAADAPEMQELEKVYMKAIDGIKYILEYGL